ncbi:MHYT domain-containing protein, partial [Bacillus sp. S2(2024)]
MEMISSTYNLPLVVLSIIIAIVDSFVALNIGVRIHLSKGTARNIWLFSGAFAMGMGIWSMHFVAMLAFHLSIPVTYNVTLVIVSIIPAIISSWLALYIVGKPSVSITQMIMGTLFMGTGIVSMHYIGMEAMEMAAKIVYNSLLLTLSAIIAFVSSFIALYLLLSLRQDSNTTGYQIRKISSSIIIGIAISGMHYTGMASAMFQSHQHQAGLMKSSFDNILFAYAIGIVMLIILGLLFISIFIDKRADFKALESEHKFRSVIESANDAIILADKKGTIMSWNKGANLLFGYQENEVLGKNLQIIIPERYHAAHQKGMKRYHSTGQLHVNGKTVELQGLRRDGS